MAKPLIALNAPGMPIPGECFLEAAKVYGDKSELVRTGKKKKVTSLKTYGAGLEKIIRRALYGRGDLVINMEVSRDNRVDLNVVSGHRWGADPEKGSAGPEPCDVMIIAKCLGEDEANRQRLMIGKSGQFFLQALRKLGIKGMKNWYVTNVLKTMPPNPNSTSLKSSWVDDFAHLLQQEIRLVRPKYILCLGTEAVKALFGKKTTLDSTRGRILEYHYRDDQADSEDADLCTAQVMATLHPAFVMREKGGGATERFELDLSRFGQLLDGDRWDKAEPDIDHRLITKEGQLVALLKEMERDNPEKIVAIDAEWHGQHPVNKGSYLRCIQVSWAHKKAACIVLNEAGGVPAFKRIKKVGDKKFYTTEGGTHTVVKLLKKHLADKRVVGHFLNADMEWLVALGLDLRPQFAAPDDWRDCRDVGGWDTGLMAHAIDETGEFNLTGLSLRYTTAPRYDVELDNWKKKFCSANKLKVGQLDGYGECPGEILYPYGNYDADVTRRIALRLAKLLDKDRFGNNCWEAFWVAQRAALAVFEINTTGLLVDRQRLDYLFDTYYTTRYALLTEIQKTLRWEDFNINSINHVREALFGEKYNGQRDEHGKPIRLRPANARSLRLMPLLNTDKRPKQWVDIMADGKESENTPSTNKTTLGIMLAESKTLKSFDVKRNTWVTRDYGREIGLIRDYRFIDQILKSVLRTPKEDEEETSFMLDDDSEFYVYDAGLPGVICSDDRVRTSISQVKETGRWSSSRPPLQNLSKRREPDYERIMQELSKANPDFPIVYEHPLRSIFVADEGYVLIEADYVGAELFGMAIMSGDTKMIEHAIRNQLPEDDPQFYDIHSNIAILAFGYTCEPTKKGLKSIGKSHMRIVAKSVVFGVAYGRGAKAIALAAREEGVTVTVEEAQQVIDTIFKLYPGLVPFFDECRSRAVTQPEAEEPAPGWLCGPFGRFRRFPPTTDHEVMGEFERQSMNFPIQGMIADAVSRAVDILYCYRNKRKMGFKLALQIHDALMFLVPYKEVPFFIDKVLPKCMSQMVDIYPCRLDGTPMDIEKPYHLGIDVEMYVHWGEHMFPNECWDRGIPEQYAGWKPGKFAESWVCNYFPNKVWLEKTHQLHAIVKDEKGQESIAL